MHIFIRVVENNFATAMRDGYIILYVRDLWAYNIIYNVILVRLQWVVYRFAEERLEN